MIQKKIILTLDTEACDLAGNVYDVGYTIHNRRGEILTTYNALVAEIFTDASKMMGAFYAKKLFTHYAPMLDRGDIALVSWADIVAQMQADVDAFGVNVLAAYNLGFDRRVMRQTNGLLGNGRILRRMPRGCTNVERRWMASRDIRCSSSCSGHIVSCHLC